MRLLKIVILTYLLITALPFTTLGQHDFTADFTTGCTPFKVKYVFTCTVDTFTTFYWDFGNGTTSTLRDPDTVVYSTQGVYTVNLVFNGRGDQMMTKNNLITVHRTALAEFTANTPTSSDLYYEFDQSCTLDGGVTYTFDWSIEEFGARTGAHQEITFPRVDTFLVALTVTDEYGCTSTASREIGILDEIYVPNVFSPGGDNSENNYFIIKSKSGLPFRIRIYSRTGILVYEGEGITIAWNGETASGEKLSSGVYYYTIEAIYGDTFKRYSKAGFVHMYRK